MKTNKTYIKKLLFLIILSSTSLYFFAQQNNKVQQPKTNKLPDIHHNPWNLIIYRPENAPPINEVRCWLKLEDENGHDVTETAIRNSAYEWIPSPKNYFSYKHTPFLSGAMAMHLNIKPGKYKISFITPADAHNFVEYDFENQGDWTSNVFEYNTDNPAKVIFVYPTANDNGFYNGGWIINYYAPEFYKYTKPKMEK